MVARKLTEDELAEHDDNYVTALEYFRNYRHETERCHLDDKPPSP